MKKIFVIFLLCGIVAIAFIPYWTGIVAEQQLPHFNQTLHSSLRLQPKDEQYTRGWLHSQSHSTFEINHWLPTTNSQVAVSHEIHHGFFPVQPTVIETTLQLEPRLCQPELAKINTTFHKLTETVSIVHLAACQIAFKQTHIQWQESEGKVELTNDLTAAIADFHIPAIQADMFKEQVTIQDIALALDIPTTITLTTEIAKLAIHKIQWDSIQNPIVVLNNLETIGKGQVNNDDLLTLAVQTTIQEVTFREQRYHSAHIDFELRHLYLPAVIEIKNVLLKLYGLDLSPEQHRLALLGSLLKYLPLLLRYQPELVITRLSAETSEGQAEGRLAVKMNGNYVSILNLLQMLDIQLQAQIPRTLLNILTTSILETRSGKKTTPLAVEAQIEKWLNQEFLHQDATLPLYKTHIQFQKSQLYINDKPSSLAILWQ